MSIDFSKAPKGATHYWPRDTGPGHLWYADRGDYLEVWNECQWARSHNRIGDRIHRSMKPIPTFEPFASVEDVPTIGSKHDPVNRPSHYASGGIECIEAIKASMSREAFLGYLKGNVQKYMWRYEKKANPVEDLKKARWYQERLIAEQE